MGYHYMFIRPGLYRACIISIILTTAIFFRICTAAETAWWYLYDSRFRVLSEDSEKATRAWAEQFDQFLDSLGSTVNNDKGILPPLTVIMFRSDRDFMPFKPLKPNGEVEKNVVGFFSNSGTPSLIALSTGGRISATLPTIYHEAVHWYVSPIKQPLPLWFEEGLAELYSTFRIKSGKVRWGEVIKENIISLRQSGDIDIEQLLAVRRRDKLFNNSHEASLFYARSWLFVHYLMFGSYEGPRDGLKKYLVGVQDTSRANAFHEAFNMDYQEMDRKLKDYLHDGKYFYMKAPLSEAKHVQNLITAQPEIVHSVLAMLAFTSRRKEALRHHADALTAVAPGTALNSDVQTLLASLNKEPDQLIRAAEQAIELGSRDARTYLLLASEIERRYTHEPGPLSPLDRLPPDAARKIADLSLSAIHINPMEMESYRKLAWALLNVDHITAEDSKVIREGARRIRDEPELKLGLAIIEKQEGKLDRAIQLVHGEEMNLGGRSPMLKAMARVIAMVWVNDNYLGRINTAIEVHDFAQAFRLFDELDAYDLGVIFHRSVRAYRENAQIMERFFFAETATQEKNYDEARKVLQDIKSMPGANGLIRHQADVTIQYIDQRVNNKNMSHN